MPPPDARQSAAKNSASKQSQADSGSSENVLQECEALEAELASLRNLYEQYFMGLDRHPPTNTHADLKKRFLRLKSAFVRSTAAKFRVASVHNKYLTYERLWMRTLQEIEAGTYKRDLFKARRRAESRKVTPGKDAQKGVVELPEDISDMEFEEVEEILRPRPANEPPVAGAATPPGGTPFRGTPAVAPVSGAPGIAPLTPPVGGMPIRGTPAVAPLSPIPPVAASGGTAGRGVPAVTAAIPSVAPVAGTPPRGLPTVTAPLGGTPARGTPVMPPGMAPKTPTAPSTPAARPPTAGAAPRPPAAGGGGGGMSDDKLRAVYDAYVTAKRRCQEDTSKLSYESVAATLRKQVPELLKQHGAKAVEFKVVIKDGKASLKAVPK
ncbi:MXAN_5187 C-terminal domain-containing protein [Pyxidicoccus trucidator]|uniref:MXAN_5187 C-terminal domain-containing protein n=1 Tax=Pyxidicoccus trucidator TaxID=2709662 RepID=UPI0013DC3617|nr:MXAN_5187 C-terminal domain-containing protein [Pyxidicoccus trucidator]